MARIFPFHAYRYSSSAGDPAALLTQPYDKISPEMQERYHALSPYNLVRIIRGRSEAGDTDSSNVYTRADGYLKDWIASGILAREPKPALFAYFQKFEAEGVTRVRKGFIGLGAVEDYSEGIVHRHELTHSGPKRDRLELLRHTHGHYGQIFMLYDDREMAIDALLDQAAQRAGHACVCDEYGAGHSLWPITNPETVAKIQELMVPRKLLIADGHHRYETALAFRNESPNLAGAGKVMMTFVNMRSPGLVILPTHRVVSNIPGFDPGNVLREAAKHFTVETLPSLDALESRMKAAKEDETVIGAVLKGNPNFYAFAASNAQKQLDVAILHNAVLEGVLGLTEESVRDERNIQYIRGFKEAAQRLDDAGGQAVFLLNAVPVAQVAEVAFSGGVMPQKSTDFFPKLLSGMTIYRIEE